jgi:phenylacetate-CoA ligase
MNKIFPRSVFEERIELQRLSVSQLRQLQFHKLKQLLAEILPTNSFYAEKFQDAKLAIDSMERLRELPFTTKQELVDDSSAAGFAKNLTWPVDRYCRFHRTSGTHGRPLVVLDTANDWQWWLEGWQSVLDAANLTETDRVVMAFSFGPFIGFWSAFDSAVERGALVAPTGAMTSLARLELIRATAATVIFCTPSYALHLAEVADQNGIEIASLPVRAIIVAGEPGGSIPSIRDQVESSWDARVVDHSGASEVGPWGFADPLGRGIYVNEAHFLPEFISLETGQAAAESELSELVLTTLGRSGSPVIRYRTGDLVRPTWSDDQGCHFVLLSGGVLGRTDDMMIIRGVNIFPTAVEQILRTFPAVIEYRLTAFKESAMDQLKIEIEQTTGSEHQTTNLVQQELQVHLGLRIDVQSVAANELPRFEGKGERFIDLR